MKLGLVLPALVSGLVVFGLAACSRGSDVEEASAADTSLPDDDAPPGRVTTSIALADGTQFDKRDCTLTVHFTGAPAAAATDVKLAGEFTAPSWGDGALPMAKVDDGFAVTLSPGPGLVAGQLYAYKLVVDSQWVLDPGASYRKIVGGQMNSGLMLPSCQGGPAIAPAPVAVKGSTMTVRASLRAAADGVPVASLRASFDNGSVPAGSYVVDAKGNVDFSWSGLEKGKHTLSLRAFDAQNRPSDPIDLPFWVEDEVFDYRDGMLYMAMIDRFADGDPTNDKPMGAPVDYDADWHGGDLQGVLKVLQTGYLEKLGVRTLWLSPLNTQTQKSQLGDGNQLYSAYHGYWPIKGRQVDPRYGGDDALRGVIAAAHKRGIRVLLDLINNQVHDDHEYVSSNPDWFRKTCQCGDDADGCGWSQRPIDCNFEPYLPDINWQVPGAEKQFISDAVNWISAFDFDGFRVDAVKHVEANAVYNLRAALTARFEQGGARVFMVGETAVGEYDSGTFFGETFTDGYSWIDAYTGPHALDGQFDFVTRNNMADGLVNGENGLDNVEAELHKAETRYRPGNRHVRFLNGHDNPRIASIAAEDPKLGCLWSSGCRGDQLPPLAYTDPAVYTKLKRALTVLYTMPGVPYIYMGDEVAFGGGADPDMRRNMLFGEGLESIQMTAPGATPGALTDQQLDLREWVRKLGATRTGSHVLRRGDRQPLVTNDPNFWVYAYTDNTTPNGIVLVAVNRGGDVTNRAVDLSSLTTAATGVNLGSIAGWTSALGPGSATTAAGGVSISLGAGQATIFLPQQ